MNRTLDIVIRLRDEASNALSGVTGTLQQHEKQINQLAVKSGVAFAAISSGVLLAARSYAGAGDELAKMSLRTGFSVDALSRLRYAADLSGTSLGAIEIASKRMSRSLIDAQKGSTDAAGAIKYLGLSANELVSMAPDEAFIRLSSAIASVENPTERSALALTLFGRSGTDLLPLLEKGEAGLRDLMQEAERVGIVFDTKAARAAVDYRDSLTRLNTSVESVKFTLGAVFLPVLDRAVNAIQPVVRGITDWIERHGPLVSGIIAAAAAATGLIFVATSLAKAFIILRAAAIALQISLGPVGWALAGISVAAGVFTAAAVSANSSTDELASTIDNASTAMNAATGFASGLGESLDDMSSKATDAAKKIKDLQEQIERANRDNFRANLSYKENLAEAFVSQEQKVADLTEQIREKEKQARKADNDARLRNEVETLKAKLREEQEALENAKWISIQNATEVSEYRRRANQTEFENRIESIIRQRGFELEQHFERLEKLNTELLEQKKIQAEITKVIEVENNKRGDSYNKLANQIRNAFSSINGAVSSARVSVPTMSMSTPALPRQHGGPVSAGSTYLVGERGPELFVPNTAGSILPNHALRSGGQITVNINGGTYLSETAAEDIGNLIIRKLQLQMAI